MPGQALVSKQAYRILLNRGVNLVLRSQHE